MSDTATLQLPGQEPVELPVITGSEGEKAIDVSKLRAKPGTSPSIRGTSIPVPAAVRSPFSTEKKGSSATGVIPSSNLLKIQASLKSPTCFCTEHCRPRNSLMISMII